MYVNQLTAEERSKVIKLTEKQCRQMMTLVYKKKMDYFKSGGDDWKEVSVFVIVIEANIVNISLVILHYQY